MRFAGRMALVGPGGTPSLSDQMDGNRVASLAALVGPSALVLGFLSGFGMGLG